MGYTTPMWLGFGEALAAVAGGLGRSTVVHRLQAVAPALKPSMTHARPLPGAFEEISCLTQSSSAGLRSTVRMPGS